MINVPTRFRDELSINLGNEDAAKFIVSALKRAEALCQTWMLTPIQILTGGTSSLSLLCSDLSGEKFILRIPQNYSAGQVEIMALNAWKEANVPTISSVEEASSSFLMKYISGKQLETFNIADIIESLEVLHSASIKEHPFPNIETNILHRIDLAWKRFSIPAHQHYLKDLYSAQEITKNLLSDGTRTVLLHGDFKLRNLLLTDNGIFSLDPNPGVGNELFDLALFLVTAHQIETLGENLESAMTLIPGNQRERLRQWVWALSVIENRPVIDLETTAEEEFIRVYHPTTR